MLKLGISLVTLLFMTGAVYAEPAADYVCPPLSKIAELPIDVGIPEVIAPLRMYTYVRYSGNRWLTIVGPVFVSDRMEVAEAAKQIILETTSTGQLNQDEDDRYFCLYPTQQENQYITVYDYSLENVSPVSRAQRAIA